MELDLLTLLFVLLASGIAFFIGSVFSPHARAFKKECQVWQGMYSGLKRSINADIEANPPDQITQILSNPVVKMLLPQILNKLNIDKSVLANFGIAEQSTKKEITQSWS